MNKRLILCLILVAIIIAAAILYRNHYPAAGLSPKTQSTDTTSVQVYTRTTGDATITVTKTNSSQVYIKGTATWQGSQPGQVNDGEFQATSSLKDGKIHIVDTDDQNDSNSRCLIDIVLSPDSKIMTVNDHPESGACAWGLNVDFSGTYH